MSEHIVGADGTGTSILTSAERKKYVTRIKPYYVQVVRQQQPLNRKKLSQLDSIVDQLITMYGVEHFRHSLLYNPLRNIYDTNTSLQSAARRQRHEKAYNLLFEKYEQGVATPREQQHMHTLYDKLFAFSH